MFLEVLLAIDELLILGFEANGVLSKSQFHTSEYSARIRKSNYFSQLCQFMQVQFHGFVSGSTKNSGCLLGYEFSLFRYHF